MNPHDTMDPTNSPNFQRTTTSDPNSPTTGNRCTASESQHEAVVDLCTRAFGFDTQVVGDLIDIGDGRGTFSKVFQAKLVFDERPPHSVAVKIPTHGRNRESAIASGAYGREALAYRELLGGSPIVHPQSFLVDEADDGSCSLVLEDLSTHRRVDQLDGLIADDAAIVLEALHRFHRHWFDQAPAVKVRTITIAGMNDRALDSGLRCLDQRWSSVVDHEQREAFAHLVSIRRHLVRAFELQRPTLCHGDPRADNVVFDSDGNPVVFDWQQMALQLPEADVAWLTATSLDVETRRAEEFALLAEIKGDRDCYRLGMALPGLAVLLLAQREIDSERAQHFVESSLQRIGSAIVDLDLASVKPN